MRYKIIDVSKLDGYHGRADFKAIRGKILKEEEMKRLWKREIDQEFQGENLKGTYHGALSITRRKRTFNMYFFALILKEIK